MRACTCLPPCAELVGFEPDFTIINACSVVNKKWQAHGLNSEVAVAFNIEKRLAVIFGTWCAVGRQGGTVATQRHGCPASSEWFAHGHGHGRESRLC